MEYCVSTCFLEQRAQQVLDISAKSGYQVKLINLALDFEINKAAFDLIGHPVDAA